MESLKNKCKNLSLRNFFILTVLCSIGLAVFFSALIIAVCASFRYWLLPDSNAAYLTIQKTLENGTINTASYLLKYGQDMSSLPLIEIKYNDIPAQENVEKTEYSIQKFENSFDMLSPKRKLAYQICGITMVAAPAVLAFFCIIFCSIYFYHRKLKRPLELLSYATGQIASQNLDFTLDYDCKDEMGMLCCSFEEMRKALYQNNKTMWEMLEERRIMQASVAHDLRNPIAIIQGYAEYLESAFENGTLSHKKLCRIIQNLNQSAKRLQHYTESIRVLNCLEEISVQKKSVSTFEMAENIEEDMRLLAQQNKILLQVKNNLPDQKIQIDTVILYRILENIMNNAFRYAKKEICLEFSLLETTLCITVTDDGEGFSPEIQKKEEKMLFSSRQDGHMGIGLAVSRRLCKKHGGDIQLYNTTGACVKINLLV